MVDSSGGSAIGLGVARYKGATMDCLLAFVQKTTAAGMAIHKYCIILHKTNLYNQ